MVTALLLGLAGCADQPAAPPPPPGLADLPKDALPLDEAALLLAEATLAGARSLPEIAAGGHRAIVIDPLIDRASGAETGATRSMVSRIETLIRERHSQLDLQPFTLAALDAQPLILLGAITPSAGPGNLASARGPTETFRIWAILGDLRTGRILSHPTAWVIGESVDATPTAFHRESPAWAEDEMVAAYLRTCAGAPGTQMDAAYLQGLRAQAALAEAIAAQEQDQPGRALALFRQATALPSGQQMRALNGIYLATLALGDEAAAEDAFGRLVDHGLTRNRLAIKLLFRPGSTEFVRDPAVSGHYAMWLRQIADRAAARVSLLRVVGHTSVTGSAITNDRLSLARAQRVRRRLIATAPALRDRSEALGLGAREPIIGLGTDDLRDALDRRVEFRPAESTVRSGGST
ncbi:OmpA family protein [Siccirubricoccus sp. KC 17139]|uniref:OmpA family protein n=1 Tax=Siccirubricoccus soli TaxID=2899147 RepID=A0ABT1D3G3_9PROT|nr:OmpA family protein [Siccirubricoccus soli]MCO6416461.1 OmpA family protein [Siccirubricoccus soli]MCP2682595.1 OmpA family protein [Siccirubricoccus soli]